MSWDCTQVLGQDLKFGQMVIFLVFGKFWQGKMVRFAFTFHSQLASYLAAEFY